MRVYVHGSGRAGREAWPNASPRDAVFAEFDPSLRVEERVDELAILTPADATLVAHSAGAVPAVLAIARHRIDPATAVLVEPALYDLGRGVSPVERHIETMTAARSRADTGDLFGFWSIVRPMMFGGPAETASWASERPTAERLASIESPWGHGITADMLDGIRTLVVTGGWNEEYEAIAGVLAAGGATHVQLTGSGHRPQDHPDFDSTVEAFLGG